MVDSPEHVIPLSVIGGFLGSGKTTLVNEILQAGQDIRTVILVNDFGSINIDEKMIAAAGGQAIALTNGCVCCSIGDDLTDALIRASEMRPPPDWIVIEASGVADPRTIAQVGVIDPVLIIDGVIVMVDVAEIRSYLDNQRLADTILRQIKAADILVLNKADLVSQRMLNDVYAWLESIAPAATIHPAINANVPWELLRSPNASLPRDNGPYKMASPVSTLKRTPNSASHHHQVFVTWTFQTTRLLRKNKIRDMLNNMPHQVLRAKGLVRLDSDPKAETILQFAGQSISLKPSGNRAPDISQIVFIGASGSAEFASVRAILTEAEI